MFIDFKLIKCVTLAQKYNFTNKVLLDPSVIAGVYKLWWLTALSSFSKASHLFRVAKYSWLRKLNSSSLSYFFFPCPKLFFPVVVNHLVSPEHVQMLSLNVVVGGGAKACR